MGENLMKHILLLLILVSATSLAISQEPSPSPTPQTSVNSSGGQNLAPSSSDSAKVPLTQNGYVRPNADKLFKKHVNSMCGPWSLGRAVASAGLSTWSNSPEEWGPHWEGFGRRFASNMGRSMMKNTMMYGMNEAFKLDRYYYRSKKRDVGSRIKNAMLSPVIARKPDGKKVFGFPRVASTYASSVIVAETWYPGTNWKDGLRNGSSTVS